MGRSGGGSTIPVYFFVPRSFLPRGRRWPRPGEDYWSWRCSQLRDVRYTGICNWTLQTFGRLRAAGFPCSFADELPDEGIIVAHRDAFPAGFVPGPRRLLVCIKPDRAPLLFAQLHVVQNPRDPVTRFGVWASRVIPHWPQPGLVPRDASRGEAFENIAYIGNDACLSPALASPAWRAKLAERGLNWRVVNRFSEWQDYSDIDAVVALRDPKTSRDEEDSANYERRKPPSKLYNAWLAGVPAVLGKETAYRAERRGPLDFLEAGSPAEALAALRRLQEDSALRRAMVRNGRLRAARLEERLLGRWRELLERVAFPAYKEWRASPAVRKAFTLGRLRFLSSAAKRRAVGLSLGHGPVV